MREQTPFETPYTVGQRVYWNYPHDDMKPGFFTVTKAPKQQRCYTYLECSNEQGEGGQAIYSELRPA